MTTEMPRTQEQLPPEFFTAPEGNDLHSSNARLRATGCPVHAINYPVGGEGYVVADYATVLKAFSDPRLSKRIDNAPAWFRDLVKDSSPVLVRNMLTADPPEHTRLRKLVSRAFVPRRMELLRPRIQEITDELIDALPEQGEVNLMEFAFSLPMRVICEFLGVPVADRPQLHTWGNWLSGAPYPDAESNEKLKDASENIERYLLDLLADRRAHLGDDLVSILVRAADEEDRFTDDELVSTLVLLIIAGHKTTANLIGSGTHALLTHPDQLELLRDRPELADLAVEEFLRFESPVYRGTLRVAAEDMELGGCPIPKESFVHLLMGSANRDPDAFEDPDGLDITRTANRHLAFGQGPHFCVGAPLSRVEGRIAFTTLLRRLPGLRLAVPAAGVEWLFDNSTSRGLVKLPVTYDARLAADARPSADTSRDR
ncbi:MULTISPECIES: cytochrome P450 family protein [unclassified Streptomyces]|uniref:cytochrome P450 family protein n=1 Tax=unclassified Streptomyces TaxID=2593676 RepID=UPI000AD8C921|nr:MULTISPECIES: cytochrome P450 [unclassified Streptomyces]MCP3767472.1 cytochrome P450 [Streptomyces sp. MAR25Y5]